MRPLSFVLLACVATPLLSGCDLFGDSPEKLAAVREADGKATGSACRHAGRAIEDCYALNAKSQRAAVFAGWREMDEYMRENKLEVVPPASLRTAAAKADEDDAAEPAAHEGGAAPKASRASGKVDAAKVEPAKPDATSRTARTSAHGDVPDAAVDGPDRPGHADKGERAPTKTKPG